MINEQKIPCPVCKNPIPFEVSALLRGAKFACTSCMSEVALAPESVDKTKDALTQYEQLKQSTSRLKR